MSRNAFPGIEADTNRVEGERDEARRGRDKMSADKAPTPRVDAFCQALYYESCAAAAGLPEYPATERSPEEAYSAAVDLARDLERSNAALIKALEAIVALDEGDQPFCWTHSGEFDAARSALAATKGGGG